MIIDCNTENTLLLKAKTEGRDGLTMNITLDNTFERVFHVFRCLTLLRGFHCLFCLHFQDLDKAKNGLMSDSQMFQKVESG